VPEIDFLGRCTLGIRRTGFFGPRRLHTTSLGRSLQWRDHVSQSFERESQELDVVARRDHSGQTANRTRTKRSDARMYFAIVKQYQRTLRALDAVLAKAVAHAEAKKFDPDNFCTARLAPDMLPFTRQVQIACDSAKRAVAGLAGKEAPVHDDTEQTMAQLRERIQKCLTYLSTFRAADFAAVTSKTEIKLANPPGKAMYADDALLARSTPNFFFHVVIAYALLRAGGVDIGKQDFLGELPAMFDQSA
jgi:uncharacterized protein